MSNDLTDQSQKEKAVSLLTDDEAAIYNSFKQSGKPSLAPTTAATFFELYLNGNDVFSIQKLNKAFDIGAVIDAKVRYQWDDQKLKYTMELQSKSISRLVQIQSESVQFLADALAVAHKKYGTALKKYLQSGDERDLEGFELGSIGSYSKSIEAILKITGQDQKKSLKVEGTLNSNLKVTDLSTKPLNQDQAAKIIEVLLSEEE